MQRLRDSLEGLGQEHLLEANPPLTDDEVAAMNADIDAFNHFYPGGIRQYVANAQKLLSDAQIGRSYLSDCKLAVPSTVVTVPPLTLKHGLDWFAEHERRGLTLLEGAAFVLVAGGLGERLGYSGIKLALPVQTATWTTYLEHYLNWIGQHCSNPQIAIMTSADTHDATVALLREIHYAGWNPSAITLIRQGSVFAFADGNARLALHVEGGGSSGIRRLLTKPHGHGDVHALLFREGIAARWLQSGLRYLVFLQDTNAAATITVPISLAALHENDGAMSFTTVPRLGGGEAVGALCQVTFPGTGRQLVMNVEYNLFDSLYLAQHGTREPPHPSGFSHFPGSINTLLMGLPHYCRAMECTRGSVPEFVNPKYAADGISFKSPARLESLMQDVAMALEGTDLIQGVVFPRELYAPVKNSVAEGLKKVQAGLEAHSAGPGEASVYSHHRMFFKAAGASIGEDVAPKAFEGLPCPLFPIVTADHRFGCHLSAIRDRLPTPSSVVISARSSLVLSGDIIIRNLDLDGALQVTAAKGCTVVIDGLVVRNRGWEAVPVANAAAVVAATDVDRMRGFQLLRHETEIQNITEAGAHTIRGADPQSSSPSNL